MEVRYPSGGCHRVMTITALESRASPCEEDALIVPGLKPGNKDDLPMVCGEFLKLHQVQPQAGDDAANKFEAAEHEVTKVPTTTITEDAGCVCNEFNHLRVMDLIPEAYTSIADFMAKPFMLADVAWTTANVANDVLGGGYEPLTAIKTTNPYWANKVQGFSMFRGTAVFRLQINASPFQQGKLLMHFLPNAAEHNAVDPSYLAMHNLNLTTKSQQPCVELDCRDTTAVLKIPYVAPSNYARLMSFSDTYGWGQMFVSVLAPLATGASGATEVDCAIYLHFEDFEVVGPTAPQAGGKKGSYKKFSVATKSRSEGGEMDSGGPISSALMHTSKAAGSLSSIPLLSGIATPLEWGLRMASGVASVFGWSKPSMGSAPQNASRAFYRYSATSDGMDPSFPLGLIHDNKIQINDHNTIREEDEMSFSFLKSVSGYIQSATWHDSDLSGSTLLSMDINPLALRSQGTKTVGAHTATYWTGPPIYYLANYFAQWRGSVIVTIKFAKTEFHSGRLQVTWTPWGYGTRPTAPTLSTANIALREIIDVRMGDSIELVLPWFVAVNYLDCSTSSGLLTVKVLNELKRPETCADHIDFLVYVKGGPDFELAGPGTFLQNATYLPLPFSPQAGDEELVSGPVGGVGNMDFSTIHCTHSVGELFTSVKQLLNRQSVVFNSSWGTQSGMSLWPWFSAGITLAAGTGALTEPKLGGDIYSSIAPMYAFYRGSIRVGIDQVAGQEYRAMTANVNPTYLANPNNSSVNTMRSLLNVVDGANSTTYVSGGPGSAIQATGHVRTDCNLGYGLWKVPYYCRTKASMVLLQTTSDLIPVELSQPTSIMNMYSGVNFATGTGGSLTRSVSDDFQFSYFIGCPPLLALYS